MGRPSTSVYPDVVAGTTRLERIAEHERNEKWKNPPLRIEMSECINCDACLRHCPTQFGAIFNHGADVVIVPELCSGCDKCLPVCPVNCIYPDPRVGPGARRPGGNCRSAGSTRTSSLSPMAERITRAEVEHVAQLARLALGEAGDRVADRGAGRDPRSRRAGLRARHARRPADRAPAPDRERVPGRRSAPVPAIAPKCSRPHRRRRRTASGCRASSVRSRERRPSRSRRPSVPERARLAKYSKST